MYYYAQLQGIYFIINATIAIIVYFKTRHSLQTRESGAVRYFGNAGLAVALDWFAEGIPLLFFPNNQFLVVMGVMVFGPLFIQLCVSYFAIMVIATRFPTVSLFYGLIPLVIGAFVVSLHLLNGAAVTYTPEGFADVLFSPLGEFLMFFTIVTVVSILAYTIFSQTDWKTPRVTLIVIGVIITGISGPLTYSSFSPLVFHSLNVASTIGMTLILIGTFLKGKQ